MSSQIARRSGVLLLSCLTLGAAQARMPAEVTAASEPACDMPSPHCSRTVTPAFAPDGRLWLAWATGSQVFVAASGDAGRRFTEPVEVTEGAVRVDPGGDARPQIAVDRRGRIVVAWTVLSGEGFVGDQFYAVSADGGASFGPPRPLSDDPAGGRFVTLRADPAGRLFAAWIDRRASDAAAAAGETWRGLALAVSWLDDTQEEAAFTPARIVHHHTCECCRLGVDFVAAGRPVLLWRNLFGTNVRDHAITTFVDEATPGPVRRVSEDDWAIDACPHHGPSLSVDDAGRYHAAWFTEGRVRQGAFYARSVDGGRSFSEPMPLDSGSGRPASRPRVLAAGRTLWLAWREFDGASTSIVARASADGGERWSPPVVVSAVQGAADQPLLVADAEGQAWLSWLTREAGYRLVWLSESESEPDPAREYRRPAE